MHPLTDEIAQRAAAYLNSGREFDMHSAIIAAARDMRAEKIPLPTAARVRKHAQAMRQQELGDAAYEADQRAMLASALEIMTLLENASGETIRTELVGRAAVSTIDGDLIMHLRAYTKRSATELAKLLTDAGIGEPEFRTLDSCEGRFTQLVFLEDPVEFILTRIPPNAIRHPELDLTTGKPIARTDINRLAALIHDR
ncbi:MAG TPA: hypothetical protein VG711_04590 [Phycisphaerales bacterium]|nr:hypothetical protein [Phycisphaerales bacterium]